MKLIFFALVYLTCARAWGDKVKQKKSCRNVSSDSMLWTRSLQHQRFDGINSSAIRFNPEFLYGAIENKKSNTEAFFKPDDKRLRQVLRRLKLRNFPPEAPKKPTSRNRKISFNPEDMYAAIDKQRSRARVPTRQSGETRQQAASLQGGNKPTRRRDGQLLGLMKLFSNIKNTTNTRPKRPFQVRDDCPIPIAKHTGKKTKTQNKRTCDKTSITIWKRPVDYYSSKHAVIKGAEKPTARKSVCLANESKELERTDICQARDTLAHSAY